MGDTTHGNSSRSGDTDSGNIENSYNNTWNWNGSTNCGNIDNSSNTWNNCTIISPPDRKREILEWLSSLEPQGGQQDERHQDIRRRRLEGIGDWVLKTDQFLKWRNCENGSVNRTLFCCGGPGVGKTYLNSLVIDELSDRMEKEDISVVHFYCNFQNQQSEVTAPILTRLLKQAVGGLDFIPEEIDRKANESSRGRGLSVPEILRLLQTTLRSHKRTFICIDALDECETEQRPEFLRSLHSIVRDSPNARLFVTGRPHIRAELEKHHGRALQIIQFQPVKEDIRRYLERKLEDDNLDEEMDGELERAIMEEIPEKISDIFLLVSLSIEAILRETTLRERRKKLEQMTSGIGLDGAYADAIGRIQGQSENRSKLAMQALMWISRSKRPLRINELRHALAVEIGSTNFDSDQVPSISTIFSCCLGLIAVNEEAKTVRLIHLTLHAYLCQHSTLFSSPDGTMAEVCITYLNLQSTKDTSFPSSEALTKTPLLKYASYYWGVHARVETTAVGKSLALKLVHEYETHISARLLLSKIYLDEGRLQEGDAPEPEGFTGLHAIAFFGNAEILTSLPRWIIALNQGKIDFTGRSPLTWAAVRGNLEVTKILLGARGRGGARSEDYEGRTAFSWAAGNGHQEIVRALRKNLIFRGALHMATYQGLAPVHYAAENGREDMVKLLLKKGVWVNQVDLYGRTALSRGAANGHEGVVKVLLEKKKIRADTADTAGMTPLSWAARGGFGGVVALLLERKDVNPNTTDIQYGRTPLSWAAGNGYTIVTRLLLARNDINRGLVDNKGRTPLWWAARHGHEEVIKMLAELTVTRDISHRTPISWATEHWRGEICISQLEENGFSPDLPDLNGRTLLSWAAGSWNVDFVRYLLNRKDANPNLADEEGQTPLWWAATKGSLQGVQLLLERADVDPNLADKTGGTPLSCAIKTRSKGTVQLLLRRANVDPNFADKDGRTPLWWAIYTLTPGQLQPPGERERADIDPNLAYTDNQTLLYGTGSVGGREVVQLLLERADVDPNFADRDGRTPFSWAVSTGTLEVVQLLLERSNVDPGLADINDRTPLSWAVAEGRLGVVQLLLERADVDPNRADKDGGTPLLWAVTGGRQGIVQLLLERANVDPNLADKNGRTPLSWAAAIRNPEAVDLLLKRHDVDPNLADKDGRTPLSWAAEKWSRALLPSGWAQRVTHRLSTFLEPVLMEYVRLGDPAAIELLLRPHGIDLNLTASDARTPRWLTVDARGWGLLRLLIKRTDVDTNLANKDGPVSFSWAAEERSRMLSPASLAKVAGALLGIFFQPRILFDARLGNLIGMRPWYSQHGSSSIHLEFNLDWWSNRVVYLLLKRNDVDPNLADKDGRTPFSWAAGTWNRKAQSFLLGRGDVDHRIPDNKGRTPQAWAARNLGFVSLLVDFFALFR